MDESNLPPVDASNLLARLSNAISANDVPSILDLFEQSPTVHMFGSEARETATGWAELSSLWTRVMGRAQGYRWNFTDHLVGGSAGSAWIAANAIVEIEDAAGRHEIPYRLTLVLNSDHKIVHYHGSEPAEAWV